RDLRGALDPEPADDVAADVEAQDLAREPLGVVRVGRELDAARLSPAARQHLRLHHDRAADVGGGRACLVPGRRHSSRCGGDSEAREQLLALMLVEVPPVSTLPAWHPGRIVSAMPLADQLTLARIAAAPIVVVLFTWDFANHAYWGTVVFCLAMSTDWFDGR